jgi:hypothetical protein
MDRGDPMDSGDPMDRGDPMDPQQLRSQTNFES